MANFILVFFFFSGISHLIFEILWAKMLIVVTGSSVFASTITISTFMAGLSLGSYFGGKWIGKIKNPLLYFSLIHLFVSAYAFVVPALIEQLKSIYIMLGDNNSSLLFLNTTRFCLSAIIFFIPSFFMGQTYPVVSSALDIFYNRSSQKKIGRLYAAVTFGGSIGAFLAGFFLIPSFGLKASNTGTLYFSFFICITSFILFLTKKNNNTNYEIKPPQMGDKNAPLFDVSENRVLLAISFLTGTTYMAYEILWLRLVTPVLESTTYTLSIILTVFIAGSAIGNILFIYLPLKGKKQFPLIAAGEVGIGLFAIFSTPILYAAFFLGRQLYELISSLSFMDTVIVKFVILFLFLSPPTILFGILLSLLTFCFNTLSPKKGNPLGIIFSYNLAGSTLGGLITGFVVIPTVGVTIGLISFGVINIIGGVTLFLYLSSNPKVLTRQKKICIPVFACILIFSIFLLQTKTNFLSQKPDPLPGEEVIYFKEGVSGNIEVSKNKQGFTILRVDNKTHGGNEPWVVYDEAQIADFSMMLADDPKDILLIGLGTGTTLNELARHKINGIDCVEIVGGLIDTLPYFLPENKNFITKEGVRIHIEDGRNYILRTNKKYDLIVLDLVHPESNNAGNLFSQQYYEIAKNSLKKDGVIAQWLPLYQLSPYEVKIILKTFSTVYPYASLWFGNKNTKFPLGVLAASKRPVALDTAFIQKKAAQSDRYESYGKRTAIQAILDNFIMGGHAIARYTRDVPVSTDDQPVLEFLVPKGLLNRPSYALLNYNEMIRLSRSLYEQYKR